MFPSVTVREALPGLVPLEEALKSALAMLEGYAAGDESAIDAGSDLITAKKRQLTTLQNNLANAAALFGQGIEGAGVYCLYAGGTGGNELLKNRLLTATDAPGPELSLCAGVDKGNVGFIAFLRLNLLKNFTIKPLFCNIAISTRRWICALTVKTLIPA